MANKKQVISQTRHKISQDEAHKEMNKKQKKDKGVFASYLVFKNIKFLGKPNELLSLADRLVVKYQNKGEEVDREVDERAGTVIYTLMEKNLCLSVARHVRDAFKHNKPEMKIQNPDDNEFYRIVVSFNK